MSVFDQNTLESLINLYADGIDSLLLAYGKPTIIYFKQTITSVNSDINDTVHLENLKKPIYKASSTEPTIVENTKNITALIRQNPSDFQRFGIKVNNPQNVIRIKTKLEYINDIQRCDYITINGDILNKYKLIRFPIPIGLGSIRYAQAYFEHI